MAGFGDKVGDAHIEIHAKVDDKSVKAAEAKLQKMVQARTASFAKAQSGEARATAANLRLVNQNLKRHYGEQTKLAQAAAKQQAKLRQQAEKAQVAASKRKRGKDGGALDFAEGLESVLSILPGQLEKLFRSPQIAGAAAVLAGVLATTIATAIGGAVAAIVAGGALIGGIVALVKKDQEVAAAFKALGTQAQDAFLQAVQPLKGNLIETFQILGNAIESFLGGLDFTPIAQLLNGISAGVSRFLAIIQPAVQTFIDIGSKILNDFVTGVLPLIGGAFVFLAQTLRENETAVRVAMMAIGALIAVGIGAITVLIKQFGFVFKAAQIQLITFTQILRNLLVVGKALPFVGGAFQALDDKLAGFQDSVKNVGDALPKMDEGVSTLGGDINKILNPALQKTNDKLETQVTKYEDILAARENYDSTIRTGLEDDIALQQGLDDITASLKENGKTYDLNSQKGRDNFAALTGALDTYKAKLIDQVRAGQLTADQANKLWDTNSKKILATAGATGVAKVAADKYAASLKGIPTDIATNVHVNTAAAQANITNLQNALAGLQGAGAKAKAEAQAKKNKANGGPIYGPGTSTSDSIPANLSNGEFVVKAKSVRSIGMSNLMAMNSTGKLPQGFANGGSPGRGRGASASQVKQYSSVSALVTSLARSVAAATKALEAWTETAQQSTEQFSSFVNLGALDTEGATAGSLIRQLSGRKASAGKFAQDLKSLKGKGLSAEALAQIAEAGPDSPLAGLLAAGISPFDVGLINNLLSGSGAFGTDLATTLRGGKPNVGPLQAKLAAAAKRKAALKPVRAKGATVSRSGNRVFAALTAQEMAAQNLKAGTYVTVLIDGKEVTAIVKKDTARQVAQTTRRAKAGRR